MNATSREINKITKALSPLLRVIDKNVRWTDYIKLSEHKLIAVGFKNGDVKYADISDMCPFDVASFILGCMEDICFEKQFLSKKRITPLLDEISDYAKQTAFYINEILNRLSEMSDGEILLLKKRAVRSGVFEEFYFSEYDLVYIRDQIKRYIITYSTSGDIYILKNLVDKL